jgi:dihydrofolate reductase
VVETQKIVFTRTLDKSEWAFTELAKGDLVEEVEKLKQQDGKDIIAYGGGTFVSALIKAGLIDEYHLFINPVALGSGMTIFKDLSQRQNLALIKSQSFDCGVALLNYEVRRQE